MLVQVQLRWRQFAVMTLAVGVFSGCGAGSDKVSCVVKVGGGQTNVSLDTKVGSSAVASVGTYSVAFSIQPGSHLRSEVKDAQGATLMTVTTGGFTGSGAGPTPDGQLDFSCTP
jgi:hypothetical protein